MAKSKQQVLTFRNVRMRPFTMVRKKEGPPFVRAHFTADLSAPIRSSMDWSIGEGQSAGKFGAVVNATSMTLIPNQKPLEGMGVQETQVDCSELNDFSFIERVDKDGTSQGTDLLFAVVSTDVDAAGKLAVYWQTVLGGDAVMKVSYSMIGRKAPAATADGEGEEE